MSFDDFKQLFTRISFATSVQGKHYSKISVKNNDIYFHRESGNSEAIPLKELYEVYMNCDFINTTILRNYISGRKFSPSLAILIESGLFDKDGNRKFEDEIIPQNSYLKEDSPINADEANEEFENEEKDEAKFFAAFANLVNSKFVKAKSLYKPVTSSDLTLLSDHGDLGLNKPIQDILDLLLKTLGSRGELNKSHLERYIDGMVVNHPLLGSRILEFDEEQHFTPARLDALRMLQKIEGLNFLDLYKQLCEFEPYLNCCVLPKHRIRDKFDRPITNFTNFQVWLSSVTLTEKKNGYIQPRPGFAFIGGRIAQRAYYDTLRDVAHLSAFNINKLLPVIRFPKAYVNLALKKDFNQATTSELQKVIAEFLLKYYKIEL